MALGYYFECWNCGDILEASENTLCAYKPIGFTHSYDVCPECYDKLMEQRDEDG